MSETSEITILAPGRINLIGEHVDYNDGIVLPAAINFGVDLKIHRNGHDTRCIVNSLNLNQSFEFDLNQIVPSDNLWENYMLGIITELHNLGLKIEGFECQLEGNIPIGSGMSSSAALECSFIFGLNELFGLGLAKKEMVKICHKSNHNFIGIKSGIMDQFASLMGKKNHVINLDCRSMKYEYIQLDLGDFELLLLNTNVSHILASSEYNTRQEECQDGVSRIAQRFPGIKSLRNVSIEMLENIKSELPIKIFQRCRHVITENSRVLAAANALKNKSLNRLGNLLYASHFSLKNDYEVSCPELDFLVNQTVNKKEVIGSRMMGGGFGGCTINIVKSTKLQSLVEKISANYQSEFGQSLTPYQVTIEDGCRLIK